MDLVRHYVLTNAYNTFRPYIRITGVPDYALFFPNYLQDR